MKVLYFDTETTGLDPELNDVIQIAAIVEIDGVEKGRCNLWCQPINWDTIAEEALETVGVTRENLKKMRSPKACHDLFVKFMKKYVIPYDKKDKFIPVAYNGEFDINMLSSWFKKLKDDYFFSFVAGHKLADPLQYVRLLEYFGVDFSKAKNRKLETMCQLFDIPLRAHDAFSDIAATKMLLEKLKGMFHNQYSQEFYNKGGFNVQTALSHQ